MQSRQGGPPLMIPNMWTLKAKRAHFRQNIVCMAEMARDVSPVEKPTLSESWLPAGLRRIALVVRNRAPFPEDGARLLLLLSPCSLNLSLSRASSLLLIPPSLKWSQVSPLWSVQTVRASRTLLMPLRGYWARKHRVQFEANRWKMSSSAGQTSVQHLVVLR